MSLAIIRNFFSENKRNILFIGAILCFFFLSYQYTFANTPQGSNSGDLGTTFISILGGGLKIVASILGVLTAFVALFLNPEWTSGTAFGLQNHLKEIWILISNVVYFIFALILIVIAIMNIMNAGDKWELKQSLPRFIVGVLIVPFSWFFVQFVVSVSAILTIGVLTLPYDTFKNEDFFTNINSDFKVCVHQKIKLGNSDTNSTGNSGAAGQFLECAEDGEKTIDEILNGSDNESGIKNGIFGIISIYTYGIMGVDGLDTISKGELNSIKAVLDLGVKGIFDLVFVIVYVLLMVALFLALFTRGVWLWMYMMLSPAFGLLYFFDKTKEGMGESGKSFNVKEFLALAMVPVYVSAALSFGLVFLFVAANGINKETTTTEQEQTIDLVGLKLTIEGYQGNSENSLFASAGGALSTIIVEMFGIVILWIAVMAALKTSETTGSIIKPISDFGNSVGSLVKSAPMYAPIIPMPGGGMQSAASLRTIGQQIEQIPNTAATTKGSSFVSDTLGMGGQGINLSSKSMNALKALQTGQGFEDPKTWTNFRDAMSQAQSTSDLSNNKSFVDLLKNMLETSGDAQAKEVGKNLTTGQPRELLKGLSILDRIGEDKYKESVVGSGTRYSEGTLLTESTLNDFLSKTSNGDLDNSTPPTTVASAPVNITVEGVTNPISIDKSQVFDVDGKVVESAIQPIRASLSTIDDDAIRIGLTSNNTFTTEQANAIIETIKSTPAA